MTKTNFSSEVRIKLDKLLDNVGDMSLKRRARKLILDLDPQKGDQIIDLGCGDGYYLYLLNNLPGRPKLIGFDNDKVVLRNARKNLISKDIKLIEGNLIKMPFRDNAFIKAIMTEVLEHIEDDDKALTETYRILKPNGVLVLTVPSYNFPFLWDPINWVLQNIFGTHIGGTGFFAGIWARHIRLYKKNELLKAIQKVGFKVETVQELTTRCLPFNHHLVNLVARLLYDSKLPSKLTDPLSKFKNTKKPYLIKISFFLINLFDKLNGIFPGQHGLNIYIKARKV